MAIGFLSLTLHVVICRREIFVIYTHFFILSRPEMSAFMKKSEQNAARGNDLRFFFKNDRTSS